MEPEDPGRVSGLFSGRGRKTKAVFATLGIIALVGLGTLLAVVTGGTHTGGSSGLAYCDRLCQDESKILRADAALHGAGKPAVKVAMAEAILEEPYIPPPVTTETTTTAPTTTAVTTTTPTTTTTASGWGSGLAVTKFGSGTFAGLTNLDSYQDFYADGGTWNTGGIPVRPGREHYYLCGVGIIDNEFGSTACGVPISVSRANGWILKDSLGREVHYGSSCTAGIYLGDIGNPAYQQAFTADVVASLNARPGIEFAVLDDVVGNSAAGCAGNTPVKYTTNAEWRTAMLSFLAVLGPGLHAAGYKLSVNAQMNSECILFSCGPDPCDGTMTKWWDTQIAPYVDGIHLEHFQEYFNTRRPVGSHCDQFWLERQSIVNHVEVTLNRDFFPSATDATAGGAAYSRASFLLETTRPTSAFQFNCGNGPCDPYLQDGGGWAKNMGAPLGPKTVFASGVEKRAFQNGMVYVNPTLVTQNADGLVLLPVSAFIG